MILLFNSNFITISIFSGYFLCPKCNVHGEWKILERIVKKAKLDAATKDYIETTRQKCVDFKKDWDKIVSDTSSVADLNENEAIELFRLFEFPVSINSNSNYVGNNSHWNLFLYPTIVIFNTKWEGIEKKQFLTFKR